MSLALWQAAFSAHMIKRLGFVPASSLVCEVSLGSASQKHYLLFVGKVIDMWTQVLTLLGLCRQDSLYYNSVFQTLLLQSATILIRLTDITVN